MEFITQLQGDESSYLTPIFLVHAISGLALPFLRLESFSDDDERPVYGITSPLHCPGGDDFEFPGTLRDLAALYVEKIKEVQPEGPYLLGGWSMGGMIAMNMARLLHDDGEKVLKVIMIDSANPESFPSFQSAKDHRSLTRLTFTRTVAADIRLMDSESSPIMSPVCSESEFGDYLTEGESRANTWGTFTTDISSSSSSAGDYDDDSPAWTPGSPATPECSSDVGSECGAEDGRLLEDFITDELDSPSDTVAFPTNERKGSIAYIDFITDEAVRSGPTVVRFCDDDDEEEEDEDDHEDDDDDDDENEPSQVRDFLRKIKQHIHDGLGVISTVERGEMFPEGVVSDFHVVLIKCRPDPFDDPSMTAREREGAIFIRSVMRQQAMCWEADKFTKFETVPFSGDHDGAFEPQYVGELSGIFRKCLQGIP